MVPEVMGHLVGVMGYWDEVLSHGQLKSDKKAPKLNSAPSASERKHQNERNLIHL